MNDNAIPGAPDEFVRVFVSYARDDSRWLDPDYRFSLIPFLMESLRRHKVAFWFDKELKPGDEFKRHIESQIDQSQIALLIVSQNFLNSEFIETREMPLIAERARLGQMIVVPVLVEPCDWSEYSFLADRQMVPSSPLIEYTESEPQWAKVRYQILDGLKAQLKRIREVPQSHAPKAQASVPEEVQPVAAFVEIPEPSKAPTVETAPPPSEPKAAVSENRAKICPAEHEKARTPRNWASTVLGGTVLAGMVAQVLLYHTLPLDWFRSVMGGAPLAAALACLLIFKPFQDKWNPAAVGGATLVSAVWVFLAFSGRFPPNWIFATMDGAALAMVLVCLRVVKPFPRNWIPAVVGGVALVAVLALPYLWNFSFLSPEGVVMIGAPLATALVCFLVFKPFPRSWTPAVVGGAALASAMWVYFPFIRWVGEIWTLAAMGGAALAAIFVCSLVFKPYPRNWIPDSLGGVALMFVVCVYHVFLRVDYFWTLVAMEEAALAMMLVCLLVFKAREKI